MSLPKGAVGRCPAPSTAIGASGLSSAWARSSSRRCALIFVGIDWSEQHHEVEVQAGSGKVLKRLRVDADIAGLSRLQEVITQAAEEPSQVVIGIESDHGLLVEAMVGSGYRVYPINPVTSARAREGESPSRSKSDHGDAHVLANLVRTKRQDLRPRAGDSEEAQAIRVRARSHLRAIRLQQRVRNQLRSALAKLAPCPSSAMIRWTCATLWPCSRWQPIPNRAAGFPRARSGPAWPVMAASAIWTSRQPRFRLNCGLHSWN